MVTLWVSAWGFSLHFYPLHSFPRSAGGTPGCVTAGWNFWERGPHASVCKAIKRKRQARASSVSSFTVPQVKGSGWPRPLGVRGDGGHRGGTPEEELWRKKSETAQTRSSTRGHRVSGDFHPRSPLSRPRPPSPA